MSVFNQTVQEYNSTIYQASNFCGHDDDEADQVTLTLLLSIRFYGQGVTVAVLSSFGLLGNVLSILTVVSMPKINLFYKLLMTLVLFDVMFSLTGGLFILETAFEFDHPLYYKWFPLVIYPVAGISMTGSTYTCLSIAAERFLGICHPAPLDSYHRKFRYYLVGIILACVLIDTPRFFEVQTKFDQKSGRTIGVEYTTLRTNSNYILAYFMWYRLFTTIIIPFALILFFNIKVFSYYKRTSMHSHVHQEKGLLAIFLCITVTFFACHLPRAVLNVYEFHLHRRSALCRSLYSVSFAQPIWVDFATCLEKILLIFNASANFVYYCLSGKEFRNRFVHIVFCCCCCWACPPCKVMTSMVAHEIEVLDHLAEEATRRLRHRHAASGEEEIVRQQVTTFSSRSRGVRLKSSGSVREEEGEEEEWRQLQHVPRLHNQFLGQIYSDNLNI